MVYSIDIGASGSIGNIFQPVESFTSPIPRGVLAIDIGRCFLVLSPSTWALDVLGWGIEKGTTSRILLDDNDTEESYNGVVALRLLGSHFLAVRTHTIELHRCDDALRPRRGNRPLKHRLPFPWRDGAVSVSDIISPVSAPEPHNERVRLNILAYDGRSLACYTVDIELPAGGPPMMEVTLIGEISPAETQLTPLTRSHWFVSAHALGPQGIRAMWIERDNLKMTRHVRLCAFNRNTTWHEMETATDAFHLPSYDLREDLTHCALAELSGCIVLGNRSGHVFLLTAKDT
ncbi:hypothetical protein C8R47DRAFT_172228 [Mycena vitilis]|nr:hypothetical protein C8R47DRAFT_172228 [Mycena vitilis]